MTQSFNRILAVDVEGSGASPPEIIELAIVEVVDLRFASPPKRWLVRPTKPISRIATSIHGIHNDDVADCPSFDAIAPEIHSLIGESPIVGHNVHVDVAFLKRAMPSWEPTFALDTLRLAKKLLPGLQSYGLSQLGQMLSLADEAERITGKKHHSAAYDASLAALLLIELLKGMTEQQRHSALFNANIYDQRQGTLL